MAKSVNQMIAENMKLVKDMKHSEFDDWSSGLPDDMTKEELAKVKEEISKMTKK